MNIIAWIIASVVLILFLLTRGLKGLLILSVLLFLFFLWRENIIGHIMGSKMPLIGPIVIAFSGIGYFLQDALDSYLLNSFVRQHPHRFELDKPSPLVLRKIKIIKIVQNKWMYRLWVVGVFIGGAFVIAGLLR